MFLVLISILLAIAGYSCGKKHVVCSFFNVLLVPDMALYIVGIIELYWEEVGFGLYFASML
jgi:hypothetical protein